MKFSNLTPMRIISSKIVVDQPSVFLVFPDTNIKIWEQIYQTNFILSNCEGIITPGSNVKFMRKNFNGKIHSLEFKKKMIEIDEASKKLKINENLHSIGNVNKESSSPTKYFFYDMSIYSKAINEFKDKIQLKRLVEMFFFESGKIWKKIKDNYPNYNVEMLFLMKDPEGFLWPMFENLRIIIPANKLNEYTFFDNFSIISTDNKYLIPVMHRKDGKNIYITQNLTKLPGYFIEDKITEKEQIVSSEPSEELPLSEKPVPTAPNDEVPAEKVLTPPDTLADEDEGNKAKGIVKGLAGELKVDTVVGDEGEIKVEINTKQLKKILSTYDIDDPVVLSNVKLAIDKYLSARSESKEPMTKEQAEILILKAINKTVHGTDELRELYVNQPKLLFDKLKNTKTYQVPLKFPKYENELIQPKDIIDLKYTCGQYRQKFEFSGAVHQNVEKIFKTLEEMPNYPIKVKKIDHEIIDTDNDRLIQYTITLQNIGGGHSQPYQIKLNIPGLVSERYFKLRNSHYVQENQQFMKPLTKTDPNEVRFLSNYAIIRVTLANFRFNSANIDDVINYIKIKYPKFIKEETEDYIKIFNGDIIGLTGNLVYSNADGTEKVEIDPETNLLIDLAQRSRLRITKYEYQLDYLFNKMREINPTETLSKSKTKLPYLEIYLGGLRLPLILYLWSQKGLLTALNDESISYSITDNEPDHKSKFSIRTNKKQYLNVFPKDFRQTCFVNGLITMESILKGRNINDINKPESAYDLLTEFTESTGAIRMVSLMTENQVDPITKDLLEFEGNSTNFVKIVGKDMVDILFKKQPDSLADLSIYRARMSEMIFNLLYKQVKAAHNHYRNKVFAYEDQDARFEFVEDFVVQGLITQSGVLQNAEPFNPIDEVALASRVVKSGKGGVPSKHSFKVSHRNIHPSNHGNISAAGTSESADVGLVAHHTMTPAIINEYGSYGIRDLEGLLPWEILSLDEAMTPMQNSMDGDRLVMARTHATQTVPVENSEIPLVVTGAEHLTGQIASTRFIHRAKYGGKVVGVEPNKYVSVKYDNNVTENLDIIPRKSRTKRGSFIRLEMESLPENSLFNKNDIVAWTKNFNQGIYSSGKNVVVCFMNYMGFCHEDSYVVTEDLAAKIKRTLVKPISIIIPPNTKVLSILQEKKVVSATDVLIEFAHNLDLEDYLKSQSENFEEEDIEKLLLSQSNKAIKVQAGFEGEIVDMKIFLNTKKDMDLKLINLHSKIVNDDRKTIEKLKENKNKEEQFSSFDNMEIGYFKVGGHKLKGGKEFVGANVVFYIKEVNPLSLGDKITNRYGSKGVISRLIEKEYQPKSEITELEPEVFISPISIFGRKNIPFLKEVYIGKIIYFLQEQCAEMAENSKISTDKIIKKLLGVYQLLAAEKIYKKIEESINKQGLSKFRKNIKNKDLKLRLIIEPFENVSMSRIKQAADLLEIPLDEKVFMPEINAWTDVAVPVGIGYYHFQEHVSEDMSNIRGADTYTNLTKQPTKGKQKSGGQSISGQDIRALLSLNADNTLNELLTFRSDDHTNKRKVYLDILSNGDLVNMPRETGEGGTSKLFHLYVKGMGLEISA